MKNLCSILLTLTFILSSQAYAWPHKDKPATTPSETTASPNAPDDKAVLGPVFDQARANLADLESLIAARNYGAALAKAKDSLDDVRLKSGIHPKAAYRQKIPVPANLLKSFVSPYTTIHQLSMDTQDGVSLAIANYRGGYFLDILNLMKRTNLIYLIAFYNELKQSGPLLQRDVDKINQDIADVISIPLYIKDPSNANYLLVFDYEVTNSDQNYLFNRELLEYVLQNGKELGIPDENALNKMMATREAKIRKDYVDSSVNVAPPTPAPVKKTKSNAEIIQSSNYHQCVSDVWSGNESNREDSYNYCLEKYQYNFENSAYRTCLSQRWNGNESSRMSKITECMDLIK